MEFNTTFNNITAIWWRSVLLMEETGIPGENHRPVANHWTVVFSGYSDSLLSGSESVQVFIVCLYMYCRWRSSYQNRRVGIPLTALNLTLFCACSKPGPGFPTWYVGVFLCSVSSFMMRGDCSFCWYWWYWWTSLFKLPFHYSLKQSLFLAREISSQSLVQYEVTPFRRVVKLDAIQIPSFGLHNMRNTSSTLVVFSCARAFVCVCDLSLWKHGLFITFQFPVKIMDFQ
jgi:hypothetical protein